ncbi:hypothetical protein PYH37_000564 [Sinorhizobium numidicum]|uniref:Uncharacterized protein n=1 Tax=Sinorhizobium numidicum TaxID=680248 RepID=A0ABY8CRB2_9HYPH|nr:hypothetical protein [Sinorhizobium numidicum]WEX75192.1 hypothetical protein PYH37_000564 [Sinorhizobium numidicum]WEX81185.1 hypothetical protein PYH38_000566 [Sinorhizobium numidicum]
MKNNHIVAGVILVAMAFTALAQNSSGSSFGTGSTSSTTPETGATGSTSTAAPGTGAPRH